MPGHKCTITYEWAYVYVGLDTRDDMKPGGGYNSTSKWMRTIFYVNKVVLYPKYEEYESTHNDTHIKPNLFDIALIRLHRRVDFTRVNNYYKINTICLPKENDRQEKEELAQVMGFFSLCVKKFILKTQLLPEANNASRSDIINALYIFKNESMKVKIK